MESPHRLLFYTFILCVRIFPFDPRELTNADLIIVCHYVDDKIILNLIRVCGYRKYDGSRAKKQKTKRRHEILVAQTSKTAKTYRRSQKGFAKSLIVGYRNHRDLYEKQRMNRARARANFCIHVSLIIGTCSRRPVLTLLFWLELVTIQMYGFGVRLQNIVAAQVARYAREVQGWRHHILAVGLLTNVPRLVNCCPDL